MKYNEETFKIELKNKYKNEISLVSRFKGLTYPIMVKDKYGILSVKAARNILNNKPGISSALNKTEYFMNILFEKFPNLELKPESEYVSAKDKMIFSDKYGLVSIAPDALLHGHIPNIRSAVSRKEYFKNMLLYLYDNKYDFKVDSTDRHNGFCKLICPIHGEQLIDNDHIFNGNGCPECNNGWTKSNIFYLIRLYDDNESFYKLGISYKTKTGKIRRFKEYRNLSYNIEEIAILEFNNFIDCRNLESSLKQIIKPFLYIPNRWENNSSTECFSNNILSKILENINKYDIVSTSTEIVEQSEKTDVN